MWRETLVTPGTPVLRAIEIIDRVGLQIALVVTGMDVCWGP